MAEYGLCGVLYRLFTAQLVITAAEFPSPKLTHRIASGRSSEEWERKEGSKRLITVPVRADLVAGTPGSLNNHERVFGRREIMCG
jgi:hypothetical protein